MPSSKGKPFLLDHCWALLQRSEKWKLREMEPKKGEVNLIDDEDDEGGRNYGRPEGTKKAKERLKSQAEAASLRDRKSVV